MSHSLKHCMPQVVDWEQKIVSGPAHGLWTAENLDLSLVPEI